MTQGFNLEESMTVPTGNQEAQKIFGELKRLIHKMEENPDLSSWAIRLTLKSIVEKGEKMMGETKGTSSVSIG